METQSRYDMNLDTKYGFLEWMDIPSLIDSCREEWYNQTLCRVNDCVVRLGVVHGEFHWHKHDEEDEVFFVIQGQLLIDIEDKVITLDAHQGYAVPKGVRHRTRAPQRTAILMIEKSSVKPTGD